MQYPGDTSESGAASTQTDLDALRALQMDVQELQRIDSLLARFSVFEAIGFERITWGTRLFPYRNVGLYGGHHRS